MQITRETDYAIRCVLYLSESPEEVVMVNEIARARRIPKSFLSKILQKLTKAGIVRSYRGVKGGFRLAKKPKRISLLDVIEAIEGPVAMNRCAINNRLCSLSNSCSAHPVWVDVRKKVEEMLKKHNFDGLINMEQSSK
jgi:Rrf2 family protein